MLNPYHLYINPLSLVSNKMSIEDIESDIKNFNNICHYLFRSIASGNVKFYIDSHIYNVRYGGHESIQKAISTISKDEMQRWYFYTKNHPMTPLEIDSEADSIEIVVEKINPNFIKGKIHKDLLRIDSIWISFDKNKIFLSEKLSVDHDKNHSIKNYNHLGQIKHFFPTYEANPKHRLHPYKANGELVSPMPLNDKQAGDLLLMAKGIDHEGDKWGYHEESGNFIRYKRTHPDRPVYHGFVCNEVDVPDQIRKLYSNEKI